MAKKTYDFSGWVSKHGVRCTDGTSIRAGAFKHSDGIEVPLVYGHDHKTPGAIIGSALLEYRPEGVYTYGSFNNNKGAQEAKEAVAHGDIKYLSVCANHLTWSGNDVINGQITEVSLVPFGGADPEAFIDKAVLAHGDGTYSEAEDKAYIFTAEAIELYHADNEEKGEEDMGKETDDNADISKIMDSLEDLTDDQKLAVGLLIKAAQEDPDGPKEAEKESAGEADEGDDNEKDADEVKHSDEEGDEHMKYNAFENDANSKKPGVISHADQVEILKMAKDSRVGTWKNAMKEYMETNEIMHADAAESVAGFDTVDTIDSYGHTSFTAILPEYKDVRPGAPELVTDDQGWISAVMNKVHKSPISRIRTGQVDIREAEQLRAKGYQKGSRKTPTGQIKLARRTTDPQTIYVFQALHRDDIIDITDFDYVQYLYNINRMMYNEELATAMLFGDGREDSDPYKIYPEHIRPIWTDDDLYTIHYDIASAAENIQGSNTSGYFGQNYIAAETMVNACLYAREDYRGSGNPDMFIDEHDLNVMLLARDRNGRRIYASRSELATTLNVNNIYAVPKIKNLAPRTSGNKQMKLKALMVNLADYSLGATKGGQVTHFTQFDIRFNQELSLLEGRQSGALTRIYSAIVLEEEVTSQDGGQDDGGNENP